MAQRRMSAALPLVLRAGLIAVAIGIGLEGTARVDDWVSFRSPILNRYRSETDLMVRTADGMHGRRHASFEKWSMNNLGYRGPDVDSAKAPGVLRVVAMGASETFGLYESAGKELPRQLEDSLRSRLAGSHCAAEVWNAALPGMALPTIMQDLRLRTRRYSPDVVVLYPTPSFYLGDRLPTPALPDSHSVERALPLTNALYPRVWPRLRNQLKALTPTFAATWLRKRSVATALRARGAGWQFDTLPSDRAIAFEADLRREVGTVRDIGAQPVLATHGDAFWGGTRREGSSEWLTAWERFNPRATGRVLIAFDSAARAAILRVAADSGLLVADAAPALAASDETPFADYQHFNDHGAGLAAGVITQRIVELIARSRPSTCR
jgi:hypothetical protein